MYLPNILKTKIDRYIQELIKWNKKTDLIGNSTIDDIYQRHILNSMQLLPFLKEQDRIIIDVGTGAGFPGLICAFYDKTRHYILYEKKKQKTMFLKHILILMGIKNVTIKENFNPDKMEYADVLTSRALLKLKDIRKIKKYSKRVILFKGENYNDEISLLNKSNNKIKVDAIKGYDKSSYFIIK